MTWAWNPGFGSLHADVTVGQGLPETLRATKFPHALGDAMRIRR